MAAPVAGARVPAVRWRSRTQVNEFLPLSMRDPTRFEGAALAWPLLESACRLLREMASFDAAGVSRGDAAA